MSGTRHLYNGANKMKKTFILLLFCTVFLLTTGFSMPVKRSVEYSDDSGKSWRESGLMSASFVAAQQAWELALRREGWRFVRVIGIDTETNKRLEVWRKNTDTLMLCLWSCSTSKTGYMWGIQNEKRS